MRKCLWIAALFALVSLLVPACKDTRESPVEWKALPDIPDQVGLAGPFAGVTNGALIVSGGANFPEAAPWDGGKKGSSG